MDYPDYMDLHDADDEVLLPSRQRTAMEFEGVKRRLYKTSTMTCCMRTRIKCTSLWTKERVVWTYVIAMTTVAIGICTAVVINYATREKNHSLLAGMCFAQECVNQPDPRGTGLLGAYTCCCNTTFVPINNTTASTTLKLCHLPAGDCAQINQSYTCYIDPTTNAIWRLLPADFFIIRTLAILAITLAGVIAIAIMIACTQSVPEELLPQEMLSRLRIERARRQYGIRT